MFDLDGTLYLGERLISGAKALVQKLHQAKKQVFYFTNNSSRSDQQYVSKLRKLGFECRKDQVIMSTHTLIAQLQADGIKKTFLLGTPAMHRMLEDAGIQSRSPKEARAVIVGFDKTLTYKKLEMAAFLIHQGLPFYVTHPDLFCPTELGPQPDCGALAQLLVLTTGIKPSRILGKPNPLMIQEVLKRTRCKKSEMILVGDRASTDLALAERAGIEAILVLTGDSKRSDLKSFEPGRFQSVRSVAELL